MRRVLRLASGLPELFLGLLMIGVVTLLLAEVVLRYFLHQPLAWSQEVAQFLFVWLALLGAAVGVKRNAHIHTDILVARLPAPSRRVATTVRLTLSLIFAATLVVSGVVYTQISFTQRFLVTQIPVGWQALALPATAALMLIYFLNDWRLRK